MQDDRSIYLDAVRAVALVRVVLYHATPYWWLTAFAAMPLMFFVAGSLFAASLDRRPAMSVVRSRYRRILIPYWLYLAAAVAVWAANGMLRGLAPWEWVGLLFPPLSATGLAGPGEGTPVELTWFALWYLQMHLVLSAVGPFLRRAQQRRPGVMWATIAVLFVLAAPTVPALAIAIFYLVCWVVGYYQHDGTLAERLRTTWPWLCGLTGPVGLVAFLGFAERSLPVAAGGVALLGVFWICLAVGLRPTVEPLLGGFGTRSVVNWFSQRSLTIYAWHGMVLYVVMALPLPGSELSWGPLLWCVVLLPPVVAAVGWAEDVAARRRPRLWPTLPADVPRPRRIATAVVDLRDGVGRHHAERRRSS